MFRYREEKRCIVPGCSSTDSEGKILLSLPKDEYRRNMWFKAVNVNKIVTTAKLYVCEDHFELSEDAQEWQKYSMGCVRRLKLKPEVVPHVNLFTPLENRIPASQLTDMASERRDNFLHDLASSAKSQFSGSSPCCQAEAILPEDSCIPTLTPQQPEENSASSAKSQFSGSNPDSKAEEIVPDETGLPENKPRSRRKQFIKTLVDPDDPKAPRPHPTPITRTSAPQPEGGIEGDAKMGYKKCIFPGCKRSTNTDPNLIYLTVPGNDQRRRSWCEAMGLGSPIKGSAIFVCENHFSLEEDAENWKQFKTAGERVRLKPDVVPRHVAPMTSQMTDTEKKRKTETLNALRSTRPNILQTTSIPTSQTTSIPSIDLNDSSDADSEPLADLIQQPTPSFTATGSTEPPEEASSELPSSTSVPEVVPMYSTEELSKTRAGEQPPSHQMSTAKKCMYPGCCQTSENGENTLFCSVPRGERRKRWFDAMGIKMDLNGEKCFVCEYHFVLEKDAENWRQYLDFGAPLRLKSSAVPRITNSAGSASVELETAEPGGDSVLMTSINYRRKYQKVCSIPDCLSAEPVKLMILVPTKERRNRWFDAMGVKPPCLYSRRYICEDHFDLPSDAENWIAYKTIGSKLKMKNTALPNCLRVVPPTSSQFPVSERKLKDENLRRLRRFDERLKENTTMRKQSHIMSYDEIECDPRSPSIEQEMDDNDDEGDDEEAVVMDEVVEDEVAGLNSATEKPEIFVSDYFQEVEIKPETIEDATHKIEMNKGIIEDATHELEMKPEIIEGATHGIAMKEGITADATHEVEVKQEIIEDAKLLPPVVFVPCDPAEPCETRTTRVDEPEAHTLPANRGTKRKIDEVVDAVSTQQNTSTSTKEQLMTEIAQLKRKLLLAEKCHADEKHQLEMTILKERSAHESELKKTVLEYEKELNKIKIQAGKEKSEFDLDLYNLCNLYK